jgi:hypothetical protein
MENLLMTPQGFFHGPTQNAVTLSSLKPTPLRLLLDGFPLKCYHHSLEGLTFFERQEHFKTQAPLRPHQDLFFVKSSEKAWVKVIFEEKNLAALFQSITNQGFPIQGIYSQVLEDAGLMQEPTLHIQALSPTTLRFLYGFGRLPYLVRYIPVEREEVEISATLSYIHQTYDKPAPHLSRELFKSKKRLAFFLPQKTSNILWKHLMAQRMILWALGGMMVLLMYLGISALIHEKMFKKKTLEAREVSLRIEKKIQTFPKETSLKLTRMVQGIEPYRNRFPGPSWQTVYDKLRTLSPFGTFIDIAWTPPKELKLLISFEGWPAIKIFEEKLKTLWPHATIHRVRHEDGLEGIIVQWHILS